MTLYSKANLRDQALTGIGVLDPTQAPTAQTIARVDPIIQQLIENLDDENLLIFDPSTNIDVEVIPARVMPPMQDLVEIRLGPSYGVEKTRQEWEADWIRAMARLRRSVLQGSEPTPAVIENF